jgi:hypothetical protein
LFLKVQTRCSKGPETSSRRFRRASSGECITSEGVFPSETEIHIIPDLWVSSFAVKTSEN